MKEATHGIEYSANNQMVSIKNYTCETSEDVIQTWYNLEKSCRPTILSLTEKLSYMEIAFLQLLL